MIFMNRYVDIDVFSLQEYEQQLMANHDVTSIYFVYDEDCPSDYLESYLDTNKNKSLQHKLAYLWFNINQFGLTDDDIVMLSKLSDKDDPVIPYLKYLVCQSNNILINNNDSSYYYQYCKKVGPHIALSSFDDEELAYKYGYTSYYYDMVNKNTLLSDSKLEDENTFNYFLDVLYKGVMLGSKLCAIRYAELMFHPYKHNFDFFKAYEALKLVLSIKPSNNKNYKQVFCTAFSSFYMYCLDHNLPYVFDIYSRSCANALFNKSTHCKLGLGICSLYGLGGNVDFKLAYDIFSKYKDYEFEYEEYIFELFYAIMHRYGVYVPKDVNKAYNLLENHKSYDRIKYEKICIVLFEPSFKFYQNYELAINLYEDMMYSTNGLFECDTVHNNICQLIGWVYQVVIKDFKKAIEIYDLAPNSPGCCNNAGTLYENDIKDMEKAFSYYKKAEMLNDPHGTWNLAMCYYYGKGVKVDIEKFNEYHKKAKDLNCKEAIEFKI